ncbi:hypothetical protein [Nocardioides convexus]|uniref:hypothetical protein n=1 Tax=Nocardioides convexus TaxID=2712224 RepID=UPI00241896DB|nr:hypothetical protein [Nocardioides convexus]
MGVEFTGGSSLSVDVGSGNASQKNADKACRPRSRTPRSRTPRTPSSPPRGTRR